MLTALAYECHKTDVQHDKASSLTYDFMKPRTALLYTIYFTIHWRRWKHLKLKWTMMLTPTPLSKLLSQRRRWNTLRRQCSQQTGMTTCVYIYGNIRNQIKIKDKIFHTNGVHRQMQDLKTIFSTNFNTADKWIKCTVQNNTAFFKYVLAFYLSRCHLEHLCSDDCVGRGSLKSQ